MKFILEIVNMKIILFPKMKKVEKNISIEQKILLIKKELTYNNPESANYRSYYLLWDEIKIKINFKNIFLWNKRKFKLTKRYVSLRWYYFW